MKVSCMAPSIPADRVPDMGKRQLMNLLLLGALSLPSVGMLVSYASFFVPPGVGGEGGGTPAKDALGNDIIADSWLKTRGPNDRNTHTRVLELLQLMVSMLSAPTLVVSSHGMRLRTSSSAPETVPSTIIKEVSSGDQHHCHWHWLTLILTMAK